MTAAGHTNEDAPTGRRWLWIACGVAVLVVVVGLLVGRSRRGDTVTILGDSITVLSTPVIRDALSDYRVDIQAKSGLRSDEMLVAAQLTAAGHPKQVVINLGSNDVMQGTGIEKLKANLEQMLSAYAGSDCIHLVTINTHMHLSPGSPKSGNPADRDAKRANEVIAQLDRAHRNVDLIDWNAIVEGAMDPAGHDTVTADSLHPNKTGQRLLAEAYAAAVKRCGKPVKL